MSNDETKARTVTLPLHLWDGIKEVAEEELRPINAQMQILLQEALAARRKASKRRPTTNQTLAK